MREAPHRLCVAPMLDWTDTYCRTFHRIITPNALLYTEMVTTGALIYGNRSQFLNHTEIEHPVAFQLGGSDPNDLAQSAKWVEEAGFCEVNLNCGCPSERVQRGAFGACLMSEPILVADCIKAMRDAVQIEVTVKHRIGLNEDINENLLHDFIGTLGLVGCKTFIVHARNAVLKGLSPKENREIPPLRYDVVYRLRHLFPEYKFILNGGIQTPDQATEHLKHIDGVMLGRLAWHQPWTLRAFDAQCFGKPLRDITRQAVLNSIKPHVMDWLLKGVPLRVIVKSWLGLFHGQARGRLFRQILSDPSELAKNDWSVVDKALSVFNT